MLGGWFSHRSVLSPAPRRPNPPFQGRVFMKRVLLSVLSAALLASAAAAQTAPAQATQVVNRSGAPEDTARIIRAFTQRESEFRKALNEYGFTRDAIIQTLAWGGQISGEYHRVSRFVFDDSGNRFA